MDYSHESIAGGSMYAVQLPAVLPPAGSAGGPPLPRDYHFLGGPLQDEDVRDLFGACINNPEELQLTLERMMAAAKQMQEQKQRKQ